MTLPTVALLSQSDRTWQTERALDTTPIEYATDPADPWAYDVLVLETPDRRMLRHVLRRQLEETTVLFRMRGDPYWGIDHWYDGGLSGTLKRAVALRMLSWVDGCVALAEHQAATYRERAGKPTRIVQLSRDVSKWPDSEHTDAELRLVTLTNCMYPTKIEPIIDYAQTVDSVLDETGGQWIIGGKGRYAERITRAVSDLEHVSFPGYVDARDRLQEANCMLHLSYFDSFAGAVLEGFASRLPVISTDHPAFTEPDHPVDPINSRNRLTSLLRLYADPIMRQTRGEHNEAYVAERYSHERVGTHWQEALTELVEHA